MISETIEAGLLHARFEKLAQDATHEGVHIRDAFLKLVKEVENKTITGSRKHMVRLRHLVTKDATGLYMYSDFHVRRLIASIDEQLDKSIQPISTARIQDSDGRLRKVSVFTPQAIVKSRRRS